MGAGSYGAGLGPAGHDPATTTARTTRTLPRALKLDPESRDYVVEDGFLADEHPVIHRAKHLLAIRRRSLASAPNVGFPSDALAFATEDSARTEAEDAAHLALKVLIDAADLRIDGVTVDEPFTGKIYIDVTNLRDGRPARLQVQR